VGEWKYTSRCSYLCAKLMLSGQLHALVALPPGKESPIFAGYEAEWVMEKFLDAVRNR